MPTSWKTKPLAVLNLHLDEKNPRLGRETFARAPREIVQYLFKHDNAIEVAQSIATRGFFPNEPLLGIREDGRWVIVEGNRRLAALKALREPGLIDGPLKAQVERLSRRITDPAVIATVPVTIAPNRRATDRQVAGRHIGTPVRAWEAENRASFILDKLAEGYDNDELRDELGFTLPDIQSARQTRAVAEMARSLDLPDEVRAKLDNPRAKIFSTVERVFDSTTGREYLGVTPDSEHGIRGEISKAEFVRILSRLVSDIALGKESSRTLNRNEDIAAYFEKWGDEKPRRTKGSFVPADVISGKSVASVSDPKPPAPIPKSRTTFNTVLPKTLKVRFGSDRIADLRTELTRTRRKDHPNAGAVLLRVFCELAFIDYLSRTGELEPLKHALEKKGVKSKFNTPEMRHLAGEMTRIARARLSESKARRVEKALKYDPAAPFTVNDLNAFVHSDDLPSERDVLQFWLRVEPLLRLILEEEASATP